MTLELRNLLQEYDEACNMPTRPTGIKNLPANHVEDENQSVKWNKEFVKQNNKAYQEAVAEVNRARDLARKNVIKKIYEYIMNEAGLKEKAARKIYEVAYAQGKSDSMYQVGCWIEKLIDLFVECKED